MAKGSKRKDPPKKAKEKQPAQACASEPSRKSAKSSAAGAKQGGKKAAAPVATEKKAPPPADKALSSICKCLRCGRISTASGQLWFAYEKVYDKKKREYAQVPVGDKCKQCGDVHKDWFLHLGWEDFCELEKEEQMAVCSTEAEKNIANRHALDIDKRLSRPKLLSWKFVLRLSFRLRSS